MSIINPPIQLTEPSMGMEGRFQLTQGHKTFTFLQSCRERCSSEQEANKCSSHSCLEASSPFFFSTGSDLVLPQADKRPERLAHTQLGERHAWSKGKTQPPCQWPTWFLRDTPHRTKTQNLPTSGVLLTWANKCPYCLRQLKTVTVT